MFSWRFGGEQGCSQAAEAASTTVGPRCRRRSHPPREYVRKVTTGGSGSRSRRREDVACGRRTRYVLRPRDSEIHPPCIHGLKHFFGRSSVARRDAELL